jgi:hypothetical protein
VSQGLAVFGIGIGPVGIGLPYCGTLTHLNL